MITHLHMLLVCVLKVDMAQMLGITVLLSQRHHNKCKNSICHPRVT